MQFSRNLILLAKMVYQSEDRKGENMEIKVHNDNVEQALKAFKQKLLKGGHFREMRARRFYEKPSEKRNRKKKEAKKKMKQAKARRFERFR